MSPPCLIGYPYRRSGCSAGAAASAAADGEAAPHLGVYRAVVHHRPLPVEGHCVRLPWVQHPRVEQTVFGGHRVRHGAVVGPRYGISWFDGGIRWLEEVVPYAHHPCGGLWFSSLA